VNSLVTDRIFIVSHLIDGCGNYRGNCEVHVKGGLISALLDEHDHSAKAEEIRRGFLHAVRVELPDSFLMPGLINSHHHAYSALARGIPIKSPMSDFPSILKKLWWKVDMALDEESIRRSATVTALESIRHGCTTIIDHHSSPSCIEGSLDIIADGFDRFNLSSILCCEISDRNGPDIFKKTISENLRFAESVRRHLRYRGMFGMHASFTLSDESLRRIAEARPEVLPIHIHAAEDKVDVEDAVARNFSGPLSRLHDFNLLDNRSLIVHGVYLSKNEIALAHDLGLWIVHNPESNCNNRVGYSDPARFDSELILLGTDGMSSNMLASLRAAQLLYAAMSKGSLNSAAFAEKVLFLNPARYASLILQRPMGTIQIGIPADFVIFPYTAPTPVASNNWLSHVIFGLNDQPASWVYANGKAVVEKGVCTVIDEAELMDDARQAAKKLWKRFESQ
jgi:putative selenium metabolism protein SsnA